MPPTSVYFVWPRRMAWTAASLMRWGVSKSGSPAPNEITSMPRARSSRALACTASVDDGASVFSRSASTKTPPGDMGGALSPPLFQWKSFGEALLHDRWNHARHRRPEARDLFDQPRRDVRVLLVRHEEHRLDGRPQLAVHERHLELVLEVRHGADAAHDAVGALAGDEVDEEPVERDDAQMRAHAEV